MWCAIIVSESVNDMATLILPSGDLVSKLDAGAGGGDD